MNFNPLGPATGTFQPPGISPPPAPAGTFSVPPPPPQQQVMFPPAAAPAMPVAQPEPRALMLPDMHAAIPTLIKQRCTFKGNAIDGDEGHMAQVVMYVMNTAPVTAVDGESKVRAIYAWLNSLTSTYEFDAEHRAKMLQQAAPSNISTQTAPQVATMPQPAAPVGVAGLPVAAVPQPPQVPQGGEKAAKGGQYLDPLDGTSYATVRGLKSHVTRAHKTDWPIFCQTHGLDTETGLKLGTQPAAPVSAHPTVAPPPSPQIPPMIGQPAAQPQPAQPPPMFQTAQPMQTQPVQPMQAMPNPPMHHSAPPVVAFQVPPPQLGGVAPPLVPAPQQTQPPAPQQPYPQHQPAPQTAFTGQTQPMQPIMQPVPPPQVAPGHIAPGLDRENLARMLGGAVDLLIVRLVDVAAVNLAGRIDVNQLALLAEQQAKGEMRILDLAQGSYGAGKQAAQRHFADLLTKYPNTFLLLNGFEPILPAGYLEIVAARACKAYSVSDQGRQVTELKLG